MPLREIVTRALWERRAKPGEVCVGPAWGRVAAECAADADAAIAAIEASGTHCVLPSSLPPRGLSRVQAAAYIGIGATKFDEMVSDGRMPKPKRIDSRCVWDRVKLDEAFAALDGGEAAPGNPLDELL